MSVRYAVPPIITDGLVLYLDAANRQSYVSGSTTWYDAAGSNISGSLINGPAFDSGNAGSIVFDGVDDYVTGSLPTFNVGSFNLWLNPSNNINSGSSFQSLIALKYTGASNSEWYVSLGSATSLLTNEYITLANVSDNTRTGLTDGGSLSANTWYNLTFNLESGTYKIYLNGVKKTETTRYGGVPQLTTPNILQIGALVRNGVISGPFQGKVASTQIYNRALSADEVSQNFNALRGRFGL